MQNVNDIELIIYLLNLLFMNKTLTVAFCVITIAMAVLICAAYWIIFEKAGEHGWWSIIPFASNYKLCKITLGTGLLFLLFFIPFVNLIMEIICLYKLSKSFGHGVGYTIGLIFLAPIFLIILAFGSSEYHGVNRV